MKGTKASCSVTWCTDTHEIEHPTDYVTHTAELDEIEVDDLAVEVTLAQHDQPGKPGAPTVRVFTHEGGNEGETTLLDLPSGTADTIGHILTTFSPAGPAHRFGIALKLAAATLLLEQAEAPVREGSLGSDPATGVELERVFRIAFTMGVKTALECAAVPDMAQGAQTVLDSYLSSSEQDELAQALAGILSRRTADSEATR